MIESDHGEIMVRAVEKPCPVPSSHEKGSPSSEQMIELDNGEIIVRAIQKTSSQKQLSCHVDSYDARKYVGIRSKVTNIQYVFLPFCSWQTS
jgi:hypothetical protein